MFTSVIQPATLSIYSSSATYSPNDPIVELKSDHELPDDSVICLLNDETSEPTPAAPISLLQPNPKFEPIVHRVLHIQSPTLPTTYIRCSVVGIKLPWLHLQVRNLEREWSFEVGLIDTRGKQGSVRFSNFQSEAILYASTIPLLHLPFKFPEITATTRTLWTTIDVYLPEVLARFSSAPVHRTDDESPSSSFTSFAHVSYVKVYSNCRLRRIWFTQDGYTPDSAWELQMYGKAR